MQYYSSYVQALNGIYHFQTALASSMRGYEKVSIVLIVFTASSATLLATEELLRFDTSLVCGLLPV